MADRPYYEAYDERYRAAHAAGIRWMGDVPSAIVSEVIERYGVSPEQPCLELGCGEGRDAGPLLARGFSLLATDISAEAIRYCRTCYPQYASRFRVLDCLNGRLDERFSFIYAIAVLHMLVPDEDRNAFYRFIREHLFRDGLALIATMGDGEREMQSDISGAFELQERECAGGSIRVASTSCRMVSFPVFEREIGENGLRIVETGLRSLEPEFDRVMFAVVKRA